MTEFRKLTSEEVFFIFKEEYRLCSPINPEADPFFDLQPTSTVAQWLDAGNLKPWIELRAIYNESYDIDIPVEEWRMAAGFSNEKTMQSVFDLLSAHAKIEVIKPVKLLGQACFSAAVFRSIKNSLEAKGIDTSTLSPSSKIEPILKKDFGEFVAQINKNFTGVIPNILETQTTLGRLVGFAGLVSIISLILGISMHEFLYVSGASFTLAITLAFIENRKFNKQEGMLTIPGIITFRDLVNRIVESKVSDKAAR